MIRPLTTCQVKIRVKINKIKPSNVLLLKCSMKYLFLSIECCPTALSKSRSSWLWRTSSDQLNKRIILKGDLMVSTSPAFAFGGLSFSTGSALVTSRVIAGLFSGSATSMSFGFVVLGEWNAATPAWCFRRYFLPKSRLRFFRSVTHCLFMSNIGWVRSGNVLFEVFPNSLHRITCTVFTWTCCDLESRSMSPGLSRYIHFVSFSSEKKKYP